MSVAKRDGVSGVGSHHPTSHSQRVVGERRGEERGREREEREEKGRGSQDGRRGREREEMEEKRREEGRERRRGSPEEKERGRASRGSIDEKKQDRRREGGGLSGQMNKNREVSRQENPVYVHSGTSLIWTPMGQKKVSFIVKCPLFRG